MKKRKLTIGVISIVLIVLMFILKNKIAMIAVFIFLITGSVFSYIFLREGDCSIKCQSEVHETSYYGTENWTKSECKKRLKTVQNGSKDSTLTWVPYRRTKLF